jgi:hypothetical protein
MIVVDDYCSPDFPAQADPGGRDQPEKQLAIAVLFQAIKDVTRVSKSHVYHARSTPMKALKWIFSDDRSWPYSFVNLCETLQMSTGKIRAFVERERGTNHQMPNSRPRRRETKICPV